MSSNNFFSMLINILLNEWYHKKIILIINGYGIPSRLNPAVLVIYFAPPSSPPPPSPSSSTPSPIPPSTNHPIQFCPRTKYTIPYTLINIIYLWAIYTYIGGMLYTLWKILVQYSIPSNILILYTTSEAKVPGSNPASPTMILMRCRIIVNNVENLRVESETSPRGKKKKIVYNKSHVFKYLNSVLHVEW